jgi:hypothetical protein
LGAAARARQRAGRFPADGDGVVRYSRHGQLVADWVEVFAPVVFEPHRRWTWPTEGSVLLDCVGFRAKATRADGRPVTGPVSFNVLAAAGYENGVLRLWRLQSAPNVLTPDWAAFLSQLDGTPPRMVTDGHSGTINAVNALWPDADDWRSEWHLQAALRDCEAEAAGVIARFGAVSPPGPGTGKPGPRDRQPRAPGATRCPRTPAGTDGPRSRVASPGARQQETHHVPQETLSGARRRHRDTGCPSRLGECGDHSCQGFRRPRDAPLPGRVRRPHQPCHRLPLVPDPLTA